jgi:DNA-binding beta-propeller fold protein YncE
MPFGLRADNRGRSGTVTPIDTANGKVLRSIGVAVGQSLTGMAVTPNGATLYVMDGDLGSHIVTPVRTASNTAGKPINLHAGVADFNAFDPSR